MKNRFKRIKAFTLSEMIVVLVITSIVVGMAFAVLNLVQKQMYGIEKNYERNTTLNRLRQCLWIDFNRCDKVFYNAKSGELFFVNEMRTIQYSIDENLIVKDRDTFNIKWEDQQFYFENVAISIGEVDALNFVTVEEFGSQQLFVSKNNSAATYMNR